MSVRSFVRSVQVCLELSIFFILAQTFKLASKLSLSSLLALSQSILHHTVGAKILRLVISLIRYDLICVSPDILRDGGRSPVRQLRPGHRQAGLVIYWH